MNTPRDDPDRPPDDSGTVANDNFQTESDEPGESSDHAGSLGRSRSTTTLPPPPTTPPADRIRTDAGEEEGDATEEEKEDGEDEAAVEIPDLSFIRQRNAIYSKRKYYKKKRYIEQLKSSKHQLEACNDKLRESNAQLETLVQRARETMTIVQRRAQEQQLAVVDALNWRPPPPVAAAPAAPAAVAAAAAVHEEQHHPQLWWLLQQQQPAAISPPHPPHLTATGRKTAWTRQAVQHGLLLRINNTMNNMNTNMNINNNSSGHMAGWESLSSNSNDPSNVIPTQLGWRRNHPGDAMTTTTTPIAIPSSNNTIANTTSLSQGLSSLLPSMETSPNAAALIQSLLSSPLPFTIPNTSAAFDDWLYRLPPPPPPPQHQHLENYSRRSTILEALQKSLQDQQAIRDNMNLQQILLANEQQRAHEQQRDVATTASLEIRANPPPPPHETDVVAAAAQQLLLQTQNWDQEALLQYYLSLASGRKK